MVSTDTAGAKEGSQNAGTERHCASDLLREHRQTILTLARKHGARNVRVFGSVARSESGADSDLDLLVDFESGHSLLDRVALIQDLEDALSIPVDVLTEKALHPMIRDAILEEARPL